MANSVAITFTCGCQVVHNGNTNSDKNMDYLMCSTHSNPKRADKPAVRDAARAMINAMQHFRVVSGN